MARVQELPPGDSLWHDLCVNGRAKLMCGFVAIMGRKGKGEPERMARAVENRGPDDRGRFDDDIFAAIHHRLSIIGPDARGR